MVSIKRYFNNAGSGCEYTLRRAVALLIEKLGDCVVDPTGQQDFRDEMKAIHDGLTPDLPHENVLVLTEAATRSLETCTAQTRRVIRKQRSDFQSIVKMVQESLLTLVGGNTQSVHALKSIGEELERDAGFPDLQSLKLHLGTCLSRLGEEIEREKTASQLLIEKLQIEIEAFRKSADVLPQREVDPTTGALLKVDCARALQHAIDRGTRHYAIVIVVNRVQAVNARFSRDAGDWMLLRFKEYVESQLVASDQLFRWAGPAMVAILERPESFDYVRARFKRALDAHIEIDYRVNGRSVLLPVSASWSIFTLATTPEATEKQIETFIASQGCLDFA